MQFHYLGYHHLLFVVDDDCIAEFHFNPFFDLAIHAELVRQLAPANSDLYTESAASVHTAGL